jgi:predicted Rdx family selenoprotein
MEKPRIIIEYCTPMQLAFGVVLGWLQELLTTLQYEIGELVLRPELVEFFLFMLMK